MWNQLPASVTSFLVMNGITAKVQLSAIFTNVVGPIIVLIDCITAMFNWREFHEFAGNNTPHRSPANLTNHPS